MKEHFLQVNGATLWVAEQGNGWSVVLVSGGPGCCDYLEPVASLIDNVVHTIRFDSRGCGRSSVTPPYDLQTAIADLDGLRKRLELERWVVLGHSWGADVALAYALAHPDCTRSVIYLCGRGLQNDQLLSVDRKLLWSDIILNLDTSHCILLTGHLMKPSCVELSTPIPKLSLSIHHTIP